MLKKLRIQTIFLTLVGIVLAVVAGAKLWHMYRVHAALERSLSSGPDAFWEIDPITSSKFEDYAFLRSDYENVSHKLADIIATDESLQRQVNAAKVIRGLSARGGSANIRSELLPDLIQLACDPKVHPSLVLELIRTIDDWVPNSGASPAERTLIQTAAKRAGDKERLAWIQVLDAIGGQEEVELLLKFGDTHNERQLWSVQHSHFGSVLWEGLLPHLHDWIRDPVIADGALEFSILILSDPGRELLLEFILDETQLAKSRSKAVEQLMQNLAGLDLLIAACEEGQAAASLTNLISAECPQHFVDERNRLQAELEDGQELWQSLIDGLDPSYWFPPNPIPHKQPPEIQRQMDEARQKLANESLDTLQLLTSRDDLTHPQQWRDWLSLEAPKTVTLSEILQAVNEHPDLLRSFAIQRRLVPYKYGRIPSDCLLLYEQMIRSDDLNLQYSGCRTLLTFTDSPEAIDVAIDLIDESSPSDAASMHPGIILMLQRRFAVNYFWDTNAWRKWAKQRRKEQQTP